MCYVHLFLLYFSYSLYIFLYRASYVMDTLKITMPINQAWFYLNGFYLIGVFELVFLFYCLILNSNEETISTLGLISSIVIFYLHKQAENAYLNMHHFQYLSLVFSEMAIVFSLMIWLTFGNGKDSLRHLAVFKWLNS